MRLDFKKIIFIVIIVCMFIALIIGYRKYKNNQDNHETTIETIETTEVTEVTEVTEATVFVEEPQTEPTEETIISNDGRKLVSLGEFRLTAYCSCELCCGEYALNRPVDENGKEIVYGSTGTRLFEGVSIAVDPNVIQYGSEVVIGDHTYIAQDTGGAIIGNSIDIYFEDHQRALNFGEQYEEVYLVKK